jgi:hypothetical protein
MSGVNRGFRAGPWALAAPVLGLFFVLAVWLASAGASASEPGTGPHKSAPAVTGTPACGLAWNIVDSPNPGDGFRGLSAVAAATANDVWATGSYTTTTSDVRQALIEHWNGSAWSVVSSPAEGALYGLAVVAPNDIWAVGYAGYSPGPYQTLIEHWNGTAWNVVPSPNPGSTGGQLASVSALSADDIWAVGFYVDGNGFITLTLHWDGSQWTQVESPNAANKTELAGVTAIATDDVWAVGAYVNLQQRYVPVTMHWDGTIWSIVTPNTGLQGYLFAVDAIATGDVWAAGYMVNTGVFQTLTFHWDGSAWTQVPSVNPGLSFNFLYGLFALASNNVWAVGRGNGTMAQHWDGSAWSVVPTQNANGGGELNSVFALSSTNIWAVGEYLGDNGTYPTLTEHYADPCAGSTATPTATSTPTISPTGTPTRTPPRTPTFTRTYTRTSTPTITPTEAASATVLRTATRTATWTLTPTFVPTITATATGGAATNSPTATGVATQEPTPTASPTSIPIASQTPTPCPMSFSDVHSTDYFYEAVRYLYCAGVISGYSDGTFRPYNNTTRGQLSKIVVLALGWTLNCPQPGHFTDVPPDNPFYCYIETAFSHGIISGYSDGTFRPGNNVTRGQLSKIIVLAMAWPDDCVPPGHFSDVPPSNAFFCYVETAFAYGIISGYADGTFKPGNNATRGQISKIVYQAVR